MTTETIDASSGLRDLTTAAAMPPSRLPNFERKVVPILGLPFDTLDLPQTVAQIRGDAFSGRRCFISTSNLHFAIAARSDPEFRSTVLGSDLNLVDGMPLVWIARLLRLPVVERVAGSDVFEALQAHPGPPIKVYLFGGPAGAAQQAADRINQRRGGLQCVGFDAAGFGSIESMSTDDLVQRINDSGAHFVIASLGAKKGQAWLQRNASRLTAPVLSHLGAVVNFAAGSIQRAPRRVRSLGFEWLWRIKEEPELWRRYWSDGSSALRLVLGRVLRDRLSQPRRTVLVSTKAPACVWESAANGGTRLRLAGVWHDENCSPWRAALAECAARGEEKVTIDLAGVEEVGGTFIALCLLARGWFGGSCCFVGANPVVTTNFRNKMAEYLLSNEG